MKELKGANMDIDLVSEHVGWDQMHCPWNDAEQTNIHKCAVKSISLFRYFRGIRYPDSVLCSYPDDLSEVPV